MAMVDPRFRMRELLKEAGDLEAVGIRSDDQSKRLAETLTEAHGLKDQIEANARSAELRSWASESSGMLTLADGTNVGVSTTQTDTVRMEQVPVRTSDVDRLQQEYQEGRYDPKARAITDSAAYKKAFRSYLRTGSGNMDNLPAATRTLQEGADASGGFLVPSDILDRVITKEPTPTRVAGRVSQLTTSRDNLIIPKVNYFSDDLYTTGMRITWTGEVPASSTTMRVTDPVFGQTHIPIYTAMMSIPVTNDMIEDSAFPLVSWISSKFAETRDLLYDNMILNGSGLGQPAGILLNPGAADHSQPAVIVSGSASSLGSSDAIAGKFLVKIPMSLPEQYDDGACWVMNKTNTALAISQLQDGNARPLWGMGIQDAGLEPGYMNRRLVGYDVVLSGFMPNIGASTYPLVFGDLKGYYLVNRVGFSVQILRELYAETNQVLVLGRLRFGGQVVEPWKLILGQCHT